MEKRLTIDMPAETHGLIKTECVAIDVSMKKFMVRAALKRINDMDEFEIKKIEKVLKDIKEGREETIPWEEVEKEMRLARAEPR